MAIPTPDSKTIKLIKNEPHVFFIFMLLCVIIYQEGRGFLRDKEYKAEREQNRKREDEFNEHALNSYKDLAEKWQYFYNITSPSRYERRNPYNDDSDTSRNIRR